jgi:Response regulator containing a CheY-like receiver domain and an HTH DNA-binding domain
MQNPNPALAVAKPNHLIRTLPRIYKAPRKIAKHVSELNVREIEFLKLVCTEMTYKEIAGKMFLSVRTIDGYRDTLFEKLDVKSRVGLVLYAIKNKIVLV